MFRCDLTGMNSLPGESPAVIVRREVTSHEDQWDYDEEGEPYVKFPGGEGPQITAQYNVLPNEVPTLIEKLNNGCQDGVDFVVLP